MTIIFNQNSIIFIRLILSIVFIFPLLFGCNSSTSKDTDRSEDKFEILANDLINKLPNKGDKITICYYPFFYKYENNLRKYSIDSERIGEKFTSYIDNKISIIARIELLEIKDIIEIEELYFQDFQQQIKRKPKLKQSNALMIGKLVDYVGEAGFNKTALTVTIITLNGQRFSVQTEWFNF